MKNEISKILREVYKVEIVEADPTTILWAAARCRNQKAALKSANRIRAKHGKSIAYAPYGHVCF